MDRIRYYLSVFRYRLRWFLLVAIPVAVLSFYYAVTLPPSYGSGMLLMVEAPPQIPDGMAVTTVSTPAVEQMHRLQRTILSNQNLTAAAERLGVFADSPNMTPNEIATAMRMRTGVETESGRDMATLVRVYFSAPTAEMATGVMREYLRLLLEGNTSFRTERASETLSFFEQEVTRLSTELATQSDRLVSFKSANSDALPDDLQFRLTQQVLLQERLTNLENELTTLKAQRERLVEIYKATGQVEGAVANAGATPEQRQLETLHRQLDEARVVFSPENPRVKSLETRIAQLETVVRRQIEQTGGTGGTGAVSSGELMLDIQLTETDARITSLTQERDRADQRLTAISDSIAQTPVNASRLEDLTRDYNNVREQYDSAVASLSHARTGERMEELSRGQAITVLEPPTEPLYPSKPRRPVIAIGGTLAGIAMGLALVALLEFLNGSARRPEDLVSRLGIRPLATLPYLSPEQAATPRGNGLMAASLVFALAVSAVLAAVHNFYMPLDTLVSQVMPAPGPAQPGAAGTVAAPGS